MDCIFSTICIIVLHHGIWETTAERTAQQYFSVEEIEDLPPDAQVTGIPAQNEHKSLIKHYCELAFIVIKASLPHINTNNVKFQSNEVCDLFYSVKKYRNSNPEYVRAYGCYFKPDASWKFVLRLTPLTGVDPVVPYDLQAFIGGGPANPP